MPAKKTSKKRPAKAGGARQAAADRGERVAAMVKDLQASKERGNEFVANPARVARQYGVTLSREEEYAVRFVNSVSLISVVGKLGRIGSTAVFNNNCSCGGLPDTKTRPV